MSLNEADTCRVYVTPKLREAGWETSPHSITEQYTFTDGRVILGGKILRVMSESALITCFYTIAITP